LGKGGTAYINKKAAVRLLNAKFIEKYLRPSRVLVL